MTIRSCIALLIAFSLIAVSATWADDAATSELTYNMQGAVLNDKIEEVKTLLAQGVDPNKPIGCGDYSPLDGAVQVGNLEMLKLLLEHGAVPKGRELLAAAGSKQYENEKMVEALLLAGADVNYRSEHGQTAIARAVHRNKSFISTNLIEFLLAQKGIELDHVNSDGDTALMYAVEQGDTKVVQMLLGAGADPETKNQNQKNAEKVARNIIRTQEQIIRLFQEAGK